MTTMTTMTTLTQLRGAVAVAATLRPPTRDGYLPAKCTLTADGEHGTTLQATDGQALTTLALQVPYSGPPAVCLAAALARQLRAGLRGKGALQALHWRGVPTTSEAKLAALQVVDQLGATRYRAEDVVSAPTMPEQARPCWPPVACKLPRQALLAALRAVLPAVCREDWRYGIDGLALQSTHPDDPVQGLALVATNGSCLHYAAVECATQQLPDSIEHLLPQEYMATLERWLVHAPGDDVWLYLRCPVTYKKDDDGATQRTPGMGWLMLWCDGWQLGLPMRPSAFPAWRSVLNEHGVNPQGTTQLTADVGHLRAVVRAAQAAQHGVPYDQLTFDLRPGEGAWLRCRALGACERTSHLQAQVEGGALTLGLAAGLLLGALRGLHGDVTLHAGEPLSPVCLADPEHGLFMVVMPIRLD